MRPILLPVLVAASAVLSPPAHAEEGPGWPADCGLVRVAEAPMTLISGHVTIPALVNGKAVRLGIDTGGPFSSLTIAAQRRIGTMPRWADFKIGTLELQRLSMGVMESFPGVDGLIAPDVLSRYDAEFDFPAKTFRLFEHHPCKGRAAYWTGSSAVISFSLTRDGHVRVPVKLNGRDMDAILDTGAPLSLLSMKDANGLFGITTGSADVKAANTVSGLWNSPYLARFTDGRWDYPSKAVRTYSYPFKTMILGGLTIQNPPIELTEGRNFLGNDFASLLLGNNVLSRFRIYIAYREQKLYLTNAKS